ESGTATLVIASFMGRPSFVVLSRASLLSAEPTRLLRQAADPLIPSPRLRGAFGLRASARAEPRRILLALCWLSLDRANRGLGRPGGEYSVRLAPAHTSVRRTRVEEIPMNEESQAVPPVDPAASGAWAEVLERLASRTAAFGRYRLEDEIAQGGQGAILRVWDEDLRRALAMKVLHEKPESV